MKHETGSHGDIQKGSFLKRVGCAERAIFRAPHTVVCSIEGAQRTPRYWSHEVGLCEGFDL